MYKCSLSAQNFDINKIAEKYAYFWQFKQRLAVHALYASNFNNVKGKKPHPHQQKQAYQIDQNK